MSILKILNKFETSKAIGLDNLAGRFLNNSSNTLCAPIAKIPNLSIKLAPFPDKCKVTKIKPFSKLTQRTSDLQLISMVIERIIHDQTMYFLSHNNFLYNYQVSDSCL